MKAELAARTVHMVAVVAAVVVIGAPLASALLNMSEDGWELEMRTGSEYDLDGMDVDSLAVNISKAVGDKKGCRILYGEYSDAVGRDFQSVASKVISSGASSARVVDSKGDLLTQDSIVYRDALKERTVMDVRLPVIVSNISSMDVSIGYKGSGIVLPATSANVKEGDVLHLDYTVPVIAKYAALALGCDEYVDIHIDYESSAVFDVKVSTDTGPPSYGFRTEGPDRDFIEGVPSDLSAQGRIGEYTGFEIGGGVIELDGRHSWPSESIRNSLDKGPVSILSGASSIELSHGTAEGLADVLKALEEGR